MKSRKVCQKPMQEVREGSGIEYLAKEAGHILAAAIAHVAGGSQLTHAGVHKGESCSATHPVLEGLRVMFSGWRLISQAFRPGEPIPLLQCCEQEEVPA